MKGIKAAASVISLFLLASCGSVYTDSMNLLYSVPLPLLIKERVAQTAAPRFDVADTEFEDPFSLMLTSDTPGADIYYTTDGSEPGGSNGFLFRNPIPVSETMTIKAIAVKEGYVKSNVVDRRYEKCEYDIYISGIISQRIAEDEATTKACFWKNEELHFLDKSIDGGESFVSDIEVSNGVLYGVGHCYNISHNAGYWINNNFIVLAGGSEICEANSIFIDANNMYIAGSIWDSSNGVIRACYWENSNITVIGGISEFSSSNRIFIYDGLVYILGDYRGNSTSRHNFYWFDGIYYTVGNREYNPYAKDLYIINNNIYIAGSQNNVNGIRTACYWRNNIKYDIGDGLHYSEAYSLIVSDDNDVYIVGHNNDQEGNYKACYWKNDELHYLDCENISEQTYGSGATAITINNHNIYISGFYVMDHKCIACYWKNGIRKDIFFADLPLFVNSIVVEKKQPN